MNEPRTTTASGNKGRLGAYIGTTVGCMGWMIGLAAVCLTTGNTDVLVRIVLPGTAISLAMAGLAITTMELALRTLGPGCLFKLILWGEVTFFCGVLTLLLNHWIAPTLESSPRMLETLDKMGGYSRISDLVPTLCLAASVVLFGIVVVRLWKREH